MKTIALCCFMLALGASAQCTFMAQPIPLKTTQRIFDNGRELGLWHIVLSNRTSTDCHVQRQAILSLAPGVTFLRNDVSLDILTRRANTSKWSVVASYGKEILKYVPAGLAAGGSIAGVPAATYTGAGLGLAQYGVNRAAARAPAPATYADQFLGDSLTLPAGGGAEFYLAAGLTYEAHTIGPLDVLGVPQPFVAPQPAVKPANIPTAARLDWPRIEGAEAWAPGVLAMVNW